MLARRAQRPILRMSGACVRWRGPNSRAACVLETSLPEPARKLLRPGGVRRSMSSSNFDLIMPYLRPIEDVIRDEGVSEVMVNGNGRVFVERDGLIEQVAVEPMSQGFVSPGVRP